MALAELAFHSYKIWWVMICAAMLVWSATVGATVVAAPEPARSPTADQADLELRWLAPPSCPSAADVHDAIEQLRPADASAAGTGVLVVDARVQVIAGGFGLDLVVSIDGDRSERRLQAADCDDLARATALVAATMRDPIAIAGRVAALERAAIAEATMLPDPPSDLVLDASPDPVAPPPHDPTPHIDTKPRRPRPVASLRIESPVGIAALPRVDAGLSFTAGLVLPRLRVELGAMHLFAQTRAHPSLADVALRVRATVGVVRACGVPGLGDWEFPLCGGGEVGVMSARGQGDAVRGADRVRQPYAAAFVEAHAAWRVTPRIALWLGFQGLLALTRPTFTVATLEPFVQTRAGGGRAKLGVEVRFP